jgi:hypothetical protein
MCPDSRGDQISTVIVNHISLLVICFVVGLHMYSWEYDSAQPNNKTNEERKNMIDNDGGHLVTPTVWAHRN